MILAGKGGTELQIEGDSDPESFRVKEGKNGIVVSHASTESAPVEIESQSRTEAKIKVDGFDQMVDTGIRLQNAK